MKKLITIMLLCLTVNSFAQTNDLTPEEIEAFKVQCQEDIDAFQMGLEIIGDKRQPAEVKEHYIKKAIPTMFLGEGDKWFSLDNNRNKIWHEAVKMQVSYISKGQPRIKDVPLKQYLTRLRDLNYKDVEIKKAQTCIMSNFYKVSDNLYMATCTFFQYFTGVSGENIVYKDKTQKDVDVYLQRVKDGSLGYRWDLKFGDINVVQSTPIE